MEKLTLPPFALQAHCLAQQVILITGANRGIGRALALQAAQYGATVILLGKCLKTLESLYDEITASGYPEPAIHPINLFNIQPLDANELAQSIKKLFGRLDGLVHNAAISGPITPLLHLSPEKWQQVIQLNLNVPYLLTQALLPLMEQRQSSILFTTSDEGAQGKAYWSAYSASKAALLGLAQALHQELENSSVRVNCINPGKVRTALRLNAYPGLDPTQFPLSQDIVPHYLYLLSHTTIRGRHIHI